ncbi:MAG TPA: glycosyltransferase [Methanolinea sp.]|nr:MAG: Glycosyltransferase AglD [Methanoregulaceae archaeon PtaU1.Bin066]HNQ30612.1 glycosyltransferase [Methanolinea sp.]HNS82530.1 glycosyltransferase [Methanolinea sp.]
MVTSEPDAGTVRPPQGENGIQANDPCPADACSVDPPYTLIIPAYNEETRIPRLLSQLGGARGEIICICEGDDHTPALVSEFAQNHRGVDIRCDRRAVRLGKGGAILEGMRQARAPLVGYMDADASTSFSQMLALFALLDGADAVIGSRWIEGSVLVRGQGLFRRLESRAFNGIIRTLFGLPFKDTQCGAKVFKKAAIDAVIEQMVSTGFEFDVELLWRIRNCGFRIREHPITWNDMGDSRVRGNDVVRMLASLLRLRFS